MTRLHGNDADDGMRVFWYCHGLTSAMVNVDSSDNVEDSMLCSTGSCREGRSAPDRTNVLVGSRQRLGRRQVTQRSSACARVYLVQSSALHRSTLHVWLHSSRTHVAQHIGARQQATCGHDCIKRASTRSSYAQLRSSRPADCMSRSRFVEHIRRETARHRTPPSPASNARSNSSANTAPASSPMW